MAETHPRVLVVEDNPAIRKSLAIFLERQGFDVVAVAEYARALELVEAEIFDALIADLDLPGGTGLDLLQTARILRPRILSILMTGYGCSAVRKQAQELELAAYLEKPFDLGDILDALHAEADERGYSLSFSPCSPGSSARTS